MHTLQDTLKAYEDNRFKWVDLEDGNGKYLYHSDVKHFIITSHINFLRGEIERFEREVTKLKGTSTHGTCCTCPDCRNPHDECECTKISILQDQIQHYQNQINEAEKLK